MSDIGVRILWEEPAAAVVVDAVSSLFPAMRKLKENIKMRVRSFVSIAAALALPVVAFAQEPATQAFTTAMEKMMAGMHMETSGDADKDFAMMMIPHHQGAIDMAKVELDYGDDPQMRAMAEKVIEAQEKEIAELKEWLAANP